MALSYRKHQRDPTPDSLRTIKVSLGAHKQILRSLGRLPRENGSAEEEDLDRLACGQARSDPSVVLGD